jgi:hypothetical protein
MSGRPTEGKADGEFGQRDEFVSYWRSNWVCLHGGVVVKMVEPCNRKVSLSVERSSAPGNRV